MLKMLCTCSCCESFMFRLASSYFSLLIFKPVTGCSKNRIILKLRHLVGLAEEKCIVSIQIVDVQHVLCSCQLWYLQSNYAALLFPIFTWGFAQLIQQLGGNWLSLSQTSRGLRIIETFPINVNRESGSGNTTFYLTDLFAIETHQIHNSIKTCPSNPIIGLLEVQPRIIISDLGFISGWSKRRDLVRISEISWEIESWIRST